MLSKEYLQCAYCPPSKAAMRGDNLRRHIQTDHPGKPFKFRPPQGSIPISSIFRPVPTDREPHGTKRPRSDGTVDDVASPGVGVDNAQPGTSSSAPAAAPSSPSLSAPPPPLSSSSSSSSSGRSTILPAWNLSSQGATLRNQEKILSEIVALKESVNKVLDGEAVKRSKGDFASAVKNVSTNFRVCWLSNQVICTICESNKYKIHTSELPAQLDRVGRFDVGASGVIPVASRRRAIIDSLKDHEKTATHRRCCELCQRAANDLTRRTRLNVSRAAYSTIVEGDSFVRFERTLAGLALAGSPVGDQNHSRKFLSVFTNAMKEELVARLSYILTCNQKCLGDRPTPLGVATDKVTLSRRTLQPVSISGIVAGKIQSYLIGAPPALDKSGLGLVTLLVDTVEASGITKNHFRSQCISLSSDGEYVNLRAGSRLAEVLDVGFCEDGSSQLHHGCDVAHRLELCHQDAHKVVDLRGLLHAEIQNKIGKSFEEVREAADDLGIRFYSPLSYCKTRWCSSERRVLLNFSRNLLAINHADGDDGRAKYLEYGWVFTFTVIFDTLSHMTEVSLISQKVVMRPWQIWKALCDYRDRLILCEAEIAIIEQSAKDGNLVPQDFECDYLPSLRKVDFINGFWQGLALWWSERYSRDERLSYVASQARSWLRSLLNALNLRALHDIPSWLRNAGATLGAEALLGTDKIDCVRCSYDQPIQEADGGLKCHDDSNRAEVFSQLGRWIASYTGENLAESELKTQYLKLQETFRSLVTNESPSDVDMTRLWERLHRESALYEGVEDALYVASHVSLKVCAESIVESECSVLGSISPRRHLSVEMRAATSLLTWNKIGMDQLDSFLEGALLRMPKTFQGFTRAGKQMYRNRKFRHSQVIDRVLNIAERPEVASVPWSAIKRTPIDEDDTAQLGTSDPSESDSEGGSDFPY